MRIWLIVAGVVMLSVTGGAMRARVRQDTSGEPRTMRLWEGKAPGAQDDAEEDRPTITLYALPKWEPGEITPEPAIIVFPGGSYTNLAMNHEGRQMANWVNGAGMVAFVVKYRLGPKYHHPVELGDAQRAVRFVRAHAKEFGVDPSRVGALGFSAGGHLVSTLETHFDAGDSTAGDVVERMSCRPDFAVLAYPVISMSADYSHPFSRENLLGKDATPEMRKALSSELNVRLDTPPTFIFSSSTDETVPVQNSVALYSALLAANVPAELHIFEKAPHGVGLDFQDEGVGEWTTLLLHWLRANNLLPKN